MSGQIFSLGNFRWLVAETIVVVLGILIALGVDDFRTDRADRRLEIEYVRRLQDDLKHDLLFLSETYYSALQTKRRALELVGPVVRGKAPVPEDLLSYLENVSLGGLMGTASMRWSADNTFRDLIATGNLRLIQDPAIRAEISNYYETFAAESARIEKRATGYVMFVHSILPGELRDDFDLDAIDEFGIEYAVQRTLSDDFRNLLNQEFNAMLFLENRPFERNGRALLASLEAYLTTLESN